MPITVNTTITPIDFKERRWRMCIVDAKDGSAALPMEKVTRTQLADSTDMSTVVSGKTDHAVAMFEMLKVIQIKDFYYARIDFTKSYKDYFTVKANMKDDAMIFVFAQNIQVLASDARNTLEGCKVLAAQNKLCILRTAVKLKSTFKNSDFYSNTNIMCFYDPNAGTQYIDVGLLGTKMKLLEQGNNSFYGGFSYFNIPCDQTSNTMRYFKVDDAMELADGLTLFNSEKMIPVVKDNGFATLLNTRSTFDTNKSMFNTAMKRIYVESELAYELTKYRMEITPNKAILIQDKTTNYGYGVDVFIDKINDSMVEFGQKGILMDSQSARLINGINFVSDDTNYAFKIDAYDAKKVLASGINNIHTLKFTVSFVLSINPEIIVITLNMTDSV